MHHRVIDHMPRIINSVEGWHNAFRNEIGHLQPCFFKLLRFYKKSSYFRRQFMQSEGGSIEEHSKLSVACEQRIYNIVINYDNCKTTEYFSI